MPLVSVLIPAYKPQFLIRSIASALNQTFADIEILVGDDTADGTLAELVAGIADPRVRYFHHGFQKGSLNCQALWERASGKYVKWLFDDDLLMPGSVETLVAALRDNPASLMAFHERVFIDANDNMTAAPSALLKMGQAARLDRAFLAQRLVGHVNNFVGEPSNIMLDRERFDGARLFVYRDWRLGFLGDVATYLNAAEHGPVVAVGGYMSAFRQHGGQASNRHSPHLSAGLYEWELLIRGEAEAGHMDRATLQIARRNLMQQYVLWGTSLPEIARLMANLDELVEEAPARLLQSERFQRDFDHARRAVAARIAGSRRKGGAAPKTCAVCESTVTGWVPHPEIRDREFMIQVGSVGSTLQNHLCPRCGCNDRERHLWLYMGRVPALADFSNKRVLHIAPEAGIERRIRALGPLEYIAGDLFPRGPEHRKIDIEQLEFPDGYFDLVICNHVLEHVERPDAALAQLSRCLAHGGHLIAQTPYSPMLKQTMELIAPPTEAFATRYFGQKDHVRLFGADIGDRIRAAGLHGDLYPHTSVLGDVDPDTWGCNGSEPFFLFSKGAAPKFAD
ncbi:glycosyltransferase [Paraburkholderia sp. HP33-1]|uniref:glycosyltransferase n=1 Tax=Paraburkholderia sp. HP33-1 TaxID=2883243 RepID=UPI001F247DF3|nr:glycosyltransferase [Paraburkholderia sp. HP33-1]